MAQTLAEWVAPNTSTFREVATVARPWDCNRTSQSAHALASVATSSFDVVERGLHLFGSEALLGNVFDVTSGGSIPQEQSVHRKLLRRRRLAGVALKSAPPGRALQAGELLRFVAEIVEVHFARLNSKKTDVSG